MADPGRPGRHAGNRHRVRILRPLRRGRASAGSRAVLIDTLHPVHEGRLFRWGFGPTEAALLEYGRTSPDALAASGSDPQDIEAAERWRRSPFYRMLQTGDSLLRRRLNAATKDEFSVLPDLLAAGMTDYVAIISRFAAEGVIGEMDGVYSSWATRAPDGFSDGHIAALRAYRAVSRARHQIGIARAHDRNADGNLSRPRRRPARAQRTDRARNCRAHRRRRLVQRSARLHAHHRHGTGTGHPIAERLLRRDRLGHSRAWRRCAQADRRRYACDLHRGRPRARLRRGIVRGDRRARRASPN